MNLPPLPEPDSYLFQHDETGQTMFVDSQQVEWGFEKNNPRLHKIGGAFTEKQFQEFARQAQYLRGDEIEAAMPTMREYARKNQKHHFSTDGTEQDPNGAHAWLERNDKPNTGDQR